MLRVSTDLRNDTLIRLMPARKPVQLVLSYTLSMKKYEHEVSALVAHKYDELNRRILRLAEK